jgi:putative aminophosphonate oxidoreductase
MRPPPSRSLWLREALSRHGEEDRPPLVGQVRADVCIVGGGYTGLWTALRLKELAPSLDVTLVEADICGGGASGRNGGMVLSLWPKFPTLRKAFGAEEAVRLARASEGAVSAIGEECRRLGIEAEYRQDGYLWVATNEAQVGSWRDVMEELEQVGEHPFMEWTPEEVTARTGSPLHVAGVFEASGAVVQPATLARGLRRAAIAGGVSVFEGSPMRAMKTVVGGWSVETGQGAVRCGLVVVATNAWAVRFAEVQRHVIVLGSDIVATPPIPERLAVLGWEDGLGISDSRLLVHYYRTTVSGRVVFGKGGGALAGRGRVGARFDGTSHRAAQVTHHFRRTYPALQDVPIETSWTGPVERTRNGLPYFAQLGRRGGVLVGVGYSGNGVGPSYLGGRVLASLALGRDDEWSGSGLARGPAGRFPPAPVRWAGGSIVRAAIARKEHREDAGRRVGSLNRRLVELAPAGLVSTKGR